MSYEAATAFSSDLSALLALAKQTQPPPPSNLVDAMLSLAKPFIELKEGVRLTAYQDSGGHWTIGYGHTPAVPGQVITQPQADMLFAHDLLTFAQGVLPLLVLTPGVGQYAALVSLAFNIGLPAFKTSSVLKAHNAGNTATAAADFLLWDKEHLNGVLVEVPGLLARRQAEAAMYLKG